MAITNLEHDWPMIRCPAGKGEETFWHVAGASRREHFSALGLKVRGTGSRMWVWDYRDTSGAKRRRSYGSPDEGVSFADAQRAILIDRVAIGEGIDPAAREREAVTSRSQNLSALIDAYLVELDHGVIRSGEPRRPEFTRKVKARLEIIRARWGRRPADTHQARRHIRPTRRVQRSAADAARHAGYRQRASLPILADRYELPHPGRGMKQRGGSREGQRYLDEAELRLAIPAMRALGYPRGSVMLMALYTGRRVNEITGMEWSELDLENGLAPSAGGAVKEPSGARPAAFRWRPGDPTRRGGPQGRRRPICLPQRSAPPPGRTYCRPGPGGIRPDQRSMCVSYCGPARPGTARPVHDARSPAHGRHAP